MGNRRENETCFWLIAYLVFWLYFLLRTCLPLKYRFRFYSSVIGPKYYKFQPPCNRKNKTWLLRWNQFSALLFSFKIVIQWWIEDRETDYFSYLIEIYQLALAVNASLGNGVVYSGPYHARGCPFRQDSLEGPPSPFTFRYQHSYLHGYFLQNTCLSFLSKVLEYERIFLLLKG